MLNRQLMIPLGITVIANVLFGAFVPTDFGMILKLVMFNLIFELLCSVFLLHKHAKSGHTVAHTLTKFKVFLSRTKIAQLIFFVYLIYRILTGMSSWLLLFYGNVLTMFYAIGFILSISSIEFKNSKKIEL